MHVKSNNINTNYTLKILTQNLSASRLKKGVISLLILWASPVFSFAQQGEPSAIINSHKGLYQSMLAGGSLSTCSSFSKRNCERQAIFQSAKQTTLYEINKDSLHRLEKFIDKNEKTKSLKALSHVTLELHKHYSNEELTKKGLFATFKKAGVETHVNELADFEYYALLDHLERLQLNEDGKRKKEIANVKWSNSKAAIAVYEAFVNQVKLRAEQLSQTPHIVVMTASSRDALEVVDFYTSVFESLGVKTTWLPIDISVAQAINRKKWLVDACDRLEQIKANHNVFDRARVYPEYFAMQLAACQQPETLIDTVKSAQGLFMNGGDQSLTLNSMLDENSMFLAFWETVQQRVKNYQMIVGGTSAGAAVQAGRVYNNRPIPMISNGSSEAAIKRGVFAALAPSQRCHVDSCKGALKGDDVTYMPSGGANIFDIGIVDTHFSERDREGRLIALALSTKSQIAVGVDETTALFYKRVGSKVYMEVLGESGVFIVDGRNSVMKANMTNNRLEKQFAGYAHYLPSTSNIEFDLEQAMWSLKPSMIKIDERKVLKAAKEGIWRNTTRQYCGSNTTTSWQHKEIEYILAPNANTQFFIDAKRQHCGYLFLPFALNTLVN